MPRETKYEKADRLLRDGKVRPLTIVKRIDGRIVEGDSGTYLVTVYTFWGEGGHERVTGKCDCEAGNEGIECSHVISAIKDMRTKEWSSEQ